MRNQGVDTHLKIYCGTKKNSLKKSFKKLEKKFYLLKIKNLL